MATIHAPFASRDYSTETHIKSVVVIEWEKLSEKLGQIITHAVAWFIEVQTDGKAEVTTISKKK